LHLVDHHQPAALVADSSDLAKILGPRRLYAAFALDRLEEHGDDAGAFGGDALERRRVVQRNAHEALDERLEPVVHPGVAGGGQRGDRAPVEGAFVDDDLGALDTTLVAVLARDL